MLASLKRLTKHSAVYGIGNIVTRLVTFLLLPLHTNQLNTNDFGVLATNGSGVHENGSSPGGA